MSSDYRWNNLVINQRNFRLLNLFSLLNSKILILFDQNLLRLYIFGNYSCLKLYLLIRHNSFRLYLLNNNSRRRLYFFNRYNLFRFYFFINDSFRLYFLNIHHRLDLYFLLNDDFLVLDFLRNFDILRFDLHGNYNWPWLYLFWNYLTDDYLSFYIFPIFNMLYIFISTVYLSYCTNIISLSCFFRNTDLRQLNFSLQLNHWIVSINLNNLNIFILDFRWFNLRPIDIYFFIN